MTFADIGASRISYELSARGDGVVVLAGGSGMPPVVWRLSGLVDELEAAGHRVLTYAASGVSPSEGPAPQSVGELAGELSSLLEHLELSGCHLVGYSLGGFIAELLARTRSDLIRAATLLASAGPLSPILRVTLDAAASLIQTLGDLPEPFTRLQELTTALSPAVLRDDHAQVELWWELAGAHEQSWSSKSGKLGQWATAFKWMHDCDRWSNLSSISIPVVVACFEHDLLFPPEGGRQAAAAIPRAAFVEIDDAAHAGLMTHPKETVSAILKSMDHV
jgi:pimeloyl-ACP methyl ester carboxylesterase